MTSVGTSYLVVSVLPRGRSQVWDIVSYFKTKNTVLELKRKTHRLPMLV